MLIHKNIVADDSSEVLSVGPEKKKKLRIISYVIYLAVTVYRNATIEGCCHRYICGAFETDRRAYFHVAHFSFPCGQHQSTQNCFPMVFWRTRCHQSFVPYTEEDASSRALRTLSQTRQASRRKVGRTVAIPRNLLQLGGKARESALFRSR